MEKLRSEKWINCFSRKERVVESWGEVKRDKILCVRFLSFFLLFFSRRKGANFINIFRIEWKHERVALIALHGTRIDKL